MPLTPFGVNGSAGAASLTVPRDPNLKSWGEIRSNWLRSLLPFSTSFPLMIGQDYGFTTQSHPESSPRRAAHPSQFHAHSLNFSFHQSDAERGPSQQEVNQRAHP